MIKHSASALLRTALLLGIVWGSIFSGYVPAEAALGETKSQIEQQYGAPYLIEDQSGKMWTADEWKHNVKSQAKAYGYQSTYGELTATVWMEYGRQNQVVKETVLFDTMIKVRNFEQYFADLYRDITKPDSTALIMKAFPKDQVGIVTRGADRSLQFVRFFTNPDDKTAVNMHTKIRGFEITSIDQATVNRNLNGTGTARLWRLTDNYFRPEQYFSEPLVARKGTDMIVIHHAAMPTSTTWEDIHDLHLSNGWAGTGYHKLVMADGTIKEGRPDNVVGAHASGANMRSIGIVLVGNFQEEAPSDLQLNAAVKATAELMKKYRIPISKIVPHRDATKGTLCPGDQFPWEEFMRRLRLAM